MKPKRYPYSGNKKESIAKITIDSAPLVVGVWNQQLIDSTKQSEFYYSQQKICGLI